MGDNGNPPTEVTLVLNLTVSDPGNQLPPVTLDTTTVSESLEVGGVVGTFRARPNASATYSLLKNSSGTFSLQSSHLVLNKELNYAEAPSHDIALAVTEFDPEAPDTEVEPGSPGETTDQVLTFTIFVQSASNCSSESEELCDPHAECSMSDDGAVHCACAPGFSGDGFVCEDVDECAAAEGGDEPACLNGGTCVDGISAFTCECAPEFSGER